MFFLNMFEKNHNCALDYLIIFIYSFSNLLYIYFLFSALEKHQYNADNQHYKYNVMIKSMTGFGKAQADTGDKRIIIEIKSLNSKQADVAMRLPGSYNSKEVEIRSLLAGRLKRGKIYCAINTENHGTEAPVEINKSLALKYIEELKEIRNNAGLSDENTDYIAVVSRFPEVIVNKTEEVDEEEFKTVMKILSLALDDIDKFRMQEGALLEKDFRKRIDIITGLLQKITPLEENRILKVRERLENELSKFAEKINVDKNRFEQELVFYLEKLDITEEKIRLSKHCDYFLETLTAAGDEKGKKLGFVLQEIGREINTIGSKANDAGIQKIVVQMKDELEKIKEQMMNIL
jgi:uncharacterized protein (TIGR00255 family)